MNYYRDNRVKSKDHFTRVNPDELEDLVELDINTKEWYLVTSHISTGQRRWAYLARK